MKNQDNRCCEICWSAWTGKCANPACECHKKLCVACRAYGKKDGCHSCENLRHTPKQEEPSQPVSGWEEAAAKLSALRHFAPEVLEGSDWERGVRTLVGEVNKMLADAGAVGVLGEENFIYKLRRIVAQAEKAARVEERLWVLDRIVGANKGEDMEVARAMWERAKENAAALKADLKEGTN